MGRLSFLALAMLYALGCAEPTGRQTAPILDGELAPDAVQVVAIVERAPSCTPIPRQLRCTGTLIGPRAVITAAHCIGDGSVRDLMVLFDADIEGAGTLVAVSRGRPHPSYDPGSRAYDLAVLVLESDAPVTPVALGSVDEGSVDASVTMLGYGGTSADDSGGGVRRSGSGRVEAVEATELRIVPDPAMSCRGDSGGPVLDEAGALIGVTSRGDPACAEYALAVRADAVEPFVADALADSLLEPPAQRAFDPAEHFCESTCVADEDCPTGTHCFGAEGAARRCVIPGLSSGELLGACADDRVCGEAPCVQSPAGCQCFQPCGFHSHADMGTDTPPGGGGCAVGSAPALWWPFLLGFVWGRQRLGRSSRK
ncbi:MAG: trypsin-like serine protease [Deltaproteobacteria bacterium]|nr:trypsin-like serine protease [Deltaproteobacteria bacterium]